MPASRACCARAAHGRLAEVGAGPPCPFHTARPAARRPTTGRRRDGSPFARAAVHSPRTDPWRVGSGSRPTARASRSGRASGDAAGSARWESLGRGKNPSLGCRRVGRQAEAAGHASDGPGRCVVAARFSMMGLSGLSAVAEPTGRALRPGGRASQPVDPCRSGGHLHGNDTVAPALDPGQTTTGRVWVYVRDDRPFGSADLSAALFHFSRDRWDERPQAHFVGWAEVFQADAYGGYGKLDLGERKPASIIEAACWARTRRRFCELADMEAAAARGPEEGCRDRAPDSGPRSSTA